MTSGRAQRVEIGVPRLLARRADVSERRRWVLGYLQLPQQSIEALRGVFGNPEAKLPGDPADHRHTSTESGVGEGHPIPPAALASRYHGERVHAGTPGERAANGRDGLRAPHFRNYIAAAHVGLRREKPANLVPVDSLWHQMAPSLLGAIG